MSLSHRGNPNLKPAYTNIELDEKQFQEYYKCATDFKYFLKNYCMVSGEGGFKLFEPREYQIRMADAILNNKFVISRWPRQSGKSTIVACIIAWLTIFNKSHTTLIAAHIHKTAIEICGKVKDVIEYLPLWMKPGILKWNDLFIEFENDSRVMSSATNEKAGRGYSIDFCVGHDTKIKVRDKITKEISELKIGEFVDICINNNDNKFVTENKKMYGYIYEIKNTITNKKYIGKRKIPDNCQNIELDSYYGSSKYLWEEIQKIGIQNFRKTIIEICNSPDELAEREYFWCKKLNVHKSEEYYNRALPGKNTLIFYGDKNFSKLQHVKDKISEKNKNRKLMWKNNIMKKFKNEEIDDALKDGWLLGYPPFYKESLKGQGKEVRPETVQKILKTKIEKYGSVCSPKQLESLKKNKSFSDSHKKNISEGHKGKIPLHRFLNDKKEIKFINSKNNKPENIQNLLEKGWLLGLGPQTDSHKKSLSKIRKGKIPKHNKCPVSIEKRAKWHRGKKRSESTKEKISNSLKGKPANNKGKKLYYSQLMNKKSFYLPGTEPEGWIKC